MDTLKNTPFAGKDAKDVCPRCGAAADKNENYCNLCGEHLNRPTKYSERYNELEKYKTSFTYKLLKVLPLVLIACSVFFLCMFWSGINGAIWEKALLFVALTAAVGIVYFNRSSRKNTAGTACAVCGTELPEGSLYCSSCGRKLGENDNQAGVIRSFIKNAPKWALITVGALSLILIAYVIFSLLADPKLATLFIPLVPVYFIIVKLKPLSLNDIQHKGSSNDSEHSSNATVIIFFIIAVLALFLDNWLKSFDITQHAGTFLASIVTFLTEYTFFGLLKNISTTALVAIVGVLALLLILSEAHNNKYDEMVYLLSNNFSIHPKFAGESFSHGCFSATGLYASCGFITFIFVGLGLTFTAYDFMIYGGLSKVLSDFFFAEGVVVSQTMPDMSFALGMCMLALSFIIYGVYILIRTILLYKTVSTVKRYNG